MNARTGSFRKWLIAAGVVASAAAWWTRLDPSAPEPARDPVPVPTAYAEAAPLVHATTASAARRLVTSMVFACLFFAGAALTAGAGNLVAHTDEPTVVATDTAAAAPAPAPEPAAADTPAPATADPAPAVETAAATPQAETVAATDTPTDTSTEAATDDVAVAKAPLRTGYAPPPATPAVAAAAAPSLSSTRSSAARTRSPRRHAAVRSTESMPVASVSFTPAVPFDLTAWENANPASPLGATAVAIARHFVGTPYVWGGASPSGGFDCSGLMQYVYGQLGISLPHYAAAQFAVFPRLSASQLRPGDLVFFEPKIDGPGHVAMYMGGDAIVEAPHTGALVRVGSLSRSAAALGFMGAVRPYAGATSALRLTAIHRSARTPASGPGTADLVFAV